MVEVDGLGFGVVENEVFVLWLYLLLIGVLLRRFLVGVGDDEFHLLQESHGVKEVSQEEHGLSAEVHQEKYGHDNKQGEKSW